MANRDHIINIDRLLYPPRPEGEPVKLTVDARYNLIYYLNDAIRNREYSNISYNILRFLSEDDKDDNYIEDCPVKVQLTTPPEVIESLRQAGFKVVFLKGYNYRGWEDIPHIISNSPSPLPIKLSMNVDLVLMAYCQIGRIPYTLVKHDNSSPFGSIINKLLSNLDQADINKLDESSKDYLSQLAEANHLEFLAKMLIQSGYSKVNVPTYDPGFVARIFHSSMSWLRVINTLDSIRTNPVTREFSLDPIFDNQWRWLTSDNISDKYFDVDHLTRLGIELPHIDIILDRIGYLCKDEYFGRSVYTNNDECDLLAIKQIIHHSIPSDKAIIGLLGGLDHRYQIIGTILVIFHNRRDVMKPHIDHPLIKHLFEISASKGMKSARTAC